MPTGGSNSLFGAWRAASTRDWYIKEQMMIQLSIKGFAWQM